MPSGTPNVKCKIWWDDNVQAYAISTPYNPDFVSAIKAIIPSSERGFSEVSKVWTFTEPYLAAMQKLAEQLWPSAGEVIVISRAQAQKKTTVPMSMRGSGDVSLAFIQASGFDAAQKAYRVATRQFHPDLIKDGGEQMAQINSLWDRIKKEVFDH